MLVVVGILSVLAALLLVAVQQARVAAQRAACAGNLHQLALAFQMYRDTEDGRFPIAARLPSAAPDLPALPAVLANYVGDARIFRCPGDSQYFPREGLSYEYPGEFRAGVSPEQLTAQGRSLERVWLLYDFDPFHGRRGPGTGRNFLYADGHVSP
jgi:prepilin-type processing-associated H-X9-DG protein